MSTIIIGKEYYKAFQSICTLAEKGCAQEIVESVEKDGSGNWHKIQTPVHTYVYSDRERVQEERAGALEFTEQGASWFASLRGGKSSDGMAEWLKLIEDVAGSFHKRYSFIEYKQTERSVNERERTQCKSALERLVSRFLPDLNGSKHPVEVRDGNAEENAEDIYGVSLRVELSGGTGVALPVLAKIYFRAYGKTLAPVAQEEARMIDESLEETLSMQEESFLAQGDRGDVSFMVDKVIGALDLLVKGRTAGASFSQSICFNGEEDERQIEELCGKLSHDNMKLECSRIKILGISHVRWINSSYIVTSGGRPVLKATVGLKGAISLICLNCAGESILSNNRFTYSLPTMEGETLRTVVIDPSKPDLGIPASRDEEIKKYSAFARHLRVLCPFVPRLQKGCERLACIGNAINFGSVENPVYRCQDCPYPEVVFSDGTGGKKHTPDLGFARDMMTLVERKLADKPNVGVCSCCGRSFSASGLKRGTCEFCRTAEQPSESDRQRAVERYKRYASVFSPFTRLKYLGKEKLCFEQYDVILFVMGKDKYVLDKTLIQDAGYLPRPQKV